MNVLLQNLLQAKSNPHVFWPLAAALGLRFGLALANIWFPAHVDQLAQTKKMVDPAITTLISYATLAAANSGPGKPPTNPTDTQTIQPK